MRALPLSAARQLVADRLSNGHAEAAAALATEILDRYPRDAATSLLLARAQMALADLPAARGRLQRLAKVLPDSRDVWLDLAACGEDGAAAIAAQLPPLPSANGDRPVISAAALGHLFLHQLLLTHCTAQLDPVWRADQARLDVGLALAEAHWRLGEAAAAEDICRAILSVEPDCLKANLILAQQLCAAGRRDTAVSMLSAAEAVDPEDAAAEDLYEWLIVRDPALVPLRQRDVTVDLASLPSESPAVEQPAEDLHGISTFLGGISPVVEPIPEPEPFWERPAAWAPPSVTPEPAEAPTPQAAGEPAAEPPSAPEPRFVPAPTFEAPAPEAPAAPESPFAPTAPLKAPAPEAPTAPEPPFVPTPTSEAPASEAPTAPEPPFVPTPTSEARASEAPTSPEPPFVPAPTFEAPAPETPAMSEAPFVPEPPSVPAPTSETPVGEAPAAPEHTFVPTPTSEVPAPEAPAASEAPFVPEPPPVPAPTSETPASEAPTTPEPPFVPEAPSVPAPTSETPVGEAPAAPEHTFAEAYAPETAPEAEPSVTASAAFAEEASAEPEPSAPLPPWVEAAAAETASDPSAPSAFEAAASPDAFAPPAPSQAEPPVFQAPVPERSEPETPEPAYATPEPALTPDPALAGTSPEPAPAVVATAETAPTPVRWLEVTPRGQVLDAAAAHNPATVADWSDFCSALAQHLGLGEPRASSLETTHGAVQLLHEPDATTVAVAPSGANLGLVRASLRRRQHTP